MDHHQFYHSVIMYVSWLKSSYNVHHQKRKSKNLYLTVRSSTLVPSIHLKSHRKGSFQVLSSWCRTGPNKDKSIPDLAQLTWGFLNYQMKIIKTLKPAELCDDKLLNNSIWDSWEREDLRFGFLRLSTIKKWPQMLKSDQRELRSKVKFMWGGE